MPNNYVFQWVHETTTPLWLEGTEISYISGGTFDKVAFSHWAVSGQTPTVVARLALLNYQLKTVLTPGERKKNQTDPRNSVNH